ncbi:gliding motility protein GldL [Gangjinia marincola]|uniref:Gliding motility protein GldL n=1 Tax=Gangjinia marincola TaxID=578463 RepID=A0ABN1MEE2_9FLAO
MAKGKGFKKFMNMTYGLGAAVVILGALFKIMHWPFGNAMLIAGLVTEALVFTVSAFEPVDEDLDWSLVYPELAGGASNDVVVVEDEDAHGVLSAKLDEMLKEAQIDASLMTSLSDSIRNFEGAARNMGPTVDSIASQKKYSEELTLAASQMETLNNLYKAQVETAARQAEVNHEVAENAEQLKVQMESLSSNLSSLNGVYGNMLSAMGANNQA